MDYYKYSICSSTEGSIMKIFGTMEYKLSNFWSAVLEKLQNIIIFVLKLKMYEYHNLGSKKKA